MSSNRLFDPLLLLHLILQFVFGLTGRRNRFPLAVCLRGSCHFGPDESLVDGLLLQSHPGHFRSRDLSPDLLCVIEEQVIVHSQSFELAQAIPNVLIPQHPLKLHIPAHRLDHFIHRTATPYDHIIGVFLTHPLVEFDDLPALLEHSPDQNAGLRGRRIMQGVEKGETERVTRENAISGGLLLLG